MRVRKGRQHINLGEISAALEAEKLMGEREPGHFYLHMQDSQVSLAALVKGRSSSKAVNDLIRASIPFHVGSGIRPFYAFVRTAKNPADDPTRGVEIRRPSRGEARWLRDLELGHYEAFDSFLHSASLAPSDLQGLPDPAELGQDTVVDGRSSKEVRAEVSRRRRRERREEHKLSDCRSCAVVAGAPKPARLPGKGVKLRAEQRRDPVALPCRG